MLHRETDTYIPDKFKQKKEDVPILTHPQFFLKLRSEAQYDPRTAGKVLHDYLENSNEPLARAYHEQSEEAL